jgi:hypothetical protein
VASSGLDMHIRLSQLSDGKLLKDIDTGPLETWTVSSYFNHNYHITLMFSSCASILRGIWWFQVAKRGT